MRLSIVTVLSMSLSMSFIHAQQSVLEGAADLERPIERQTVPAEVLADAVKAVQKVGDQTLKGEFDAVVAQLYPRFRKRAAKKLGGTEKLAAQMQRMVDEFAAGGMTVTKFVAEPAIHGFDIPEFNEWLVFVPTTRIVRRIDPTTGLRRQMEFGDYQVAIRSKAVGSEWSFLNGSTLKVQELRAFFPTLPADIEEWAVPQKRYRELP